MDEFRPLLNRSLVALAVGTVAVVICYYFVDRPVAFFVHQHGIAKFEEFRWLTEPPPLVQSWAPLVLVLLAIRRTLGPWRVWQRTLFLACVSLIVADQFRESLGDVFGRYWPETWRNNNPSLIGTGAYGFHWFHAGPAGSSFPSGHAARIVAFFSVFWITMPRGRWIYAVVATAMCVALAAMDYHFVGDVVAGSVIGGIVGAYTARLARVGEPNG